MPNNTIISRNDLIATGVAISGAAIGAAIAAALSLPNTYLIPCGITGCVIGQFMGRWSVKHKQSEDQDEEGIGIGTVRGLSIWVSVCVAIGLLIAYLEGVPMQAVVQAASVMALFAAAGLGTTMVAKFLQRCKRGN